MMATDGSGRVRLLAALLVAYGLYAALFIARTSFIVDGQRYFSLFDDAMVSMVYAKHLAAGLGLVWSASGPRIEGYTNPLWVAYMAAIHLLPISAARISLAIQVTGAATMLATTIVAWRLAGRLTSASTFAAATAAALVAFYLPLNNWTLQGMEVGAMALATAWAAERACRALDGRTFSAVPYWILGAATLLRPDAVVPLAAMTAVLAAVDRGHRAAHLRAGAAILGVSMAGQTALRMAYFGSPLPNTYYLKLSGYPLDLRIGRGLLVFAGFVWRANVLFFVAPMALVVARWRDARVALLSAMTAAVMAYSVFVGGDAWEWWGGANRYICAVMPLFFVLLAGSLDELRRRLFARPDSALNVALATAVVCLAMVNFNILKTPASLKEAALLTPPMHVDTNALRVREAFAVRELTDAQARVAVTWAGALPYFADRDCIDLLGKADAVIAHEPMHRLSAGLERWILFWPGHLKWDYAYSIGRLRPDVVTAVWLEPDTAMPFLRGRYSVWRRGDLSFYLLEGSPHVDWDAARRSGTLEAVR